MLLFFLIEYHVLVLQGRWGDFHVHGGYGGGSERKGNWSKWIKKVKTRLSSATGNPGISSTERTKPTQVGSYKTIVIQPLPGAMAVLSALYISPKKATESRSSLDQ